ncbi:MAG: hypothetical protein SO057_05500 [Atopobiaceae bacterium]|nr:hypothetical protein [Atopobiaceae bacterium]
MEAASSWRFQRKPSKGVSVMQGKGKYVVLAAFLSLGLAIPAPVWAADSQAAEEPAAAAEAKEAGEEAATKSEAASSEESSAATASAASESDASAATASKPAASSSKASIAAAETNDVEDISKGD